MQKSCTKYSSSNKMISKIVKPTLDATKKNNEDDNLWLHA